MDKAQPAYLVEIHASDVIADPEFVLDTVVIIYPHEPGEPRVVPIDTRLDVDVFNGKLVLYFSGARLVLFASEPHERFPLYELLYFLIYRSRVHYNIISPPTMGLELPNLEPNSEVTFSMKRRTKVECDETIGGKRCLVWNYETEPCTVTVTRQELEDLLTFWTPQLHFALAYYLRGCENPKYFLIEFYKAVESIENALGGEGKTIASLEPYGVTGAVFKKLKRDAKYL
jgi:hypothetical protein